MNTAEELVRTRRQPLAQLVVCTGCCCGREDRGFPPVPLEQLKAVWKAEKLNQTVQLTVSGCLGPCDIANVAAVFTPQAHEWFGRLHQGDHYDALIAWARACRSARVLLPRPDLLRPHRFERFASAVDLVGRPVAVSPARVIRAGE